MESLVDVRAIQAADLQMVGEFLAEYMPTPPVRSAEGWVRFLSANWASERPNYGFMLVDNRRVTGVLGTIYSDQLVCGNHERFGNLTSWFVLPEYRNQGLKLILACVSQPGYHFTNFTPSKVVQQICTFMKFSVIDDRAYIIPAMPWDLVAKSALVTESSERLWEGLEGDARQVYADHRAVRRLHHLMAGTPGRTLYVAYRRSTVAGLPCARILMTSSPQLFSDYLPAIRRYLALRHCLLIVATDSRFLARVPRISIPRTLSMLRMSRTSLESEKRRYIHGLYSEFVPMLNE
jgi:hypothetical protein